MGAPLPPPHPARSRLVLLCALGSLSGRAAGTGEAVLAGATRYSKILTTGYTASFMCAARLEDGATVCWNKGSGTSSQCNECPPKLVLASGSCGADHAVGCRGIEANTNLVTRWGGSSSASYNNPNTPFGAVACSGAICCSVPPGNGPAICWGYGQLTPPTDSLLANPLSLSHGQSFCCGIKSSNGATLCWGSNNNGKSSPPASPLLGMLSCGIDHCCGVPVVGGVGVCWGSNSHNQATPPSDSLSKLSCGHRHCCALRSDDQTPVCWGDFNIGNVPAVALLDLSCGNLFCCGLDLAGIPLCWGSSSHVLKPLFDNLSLNVTASSESADRLRLTVFGSGLSTRAGDELALVPLPSGVLSGDTCQQQPIASYNHLNFTNCEKDPYTGYLRDVDASNVCSPTQRTVVISAPDIALAVCYQMQHMSSFLDPVGVIQGCSDGGQCVAPSAPLCLTQAMHGVSAIVCLPGFQTASLALVSDPPSPSASSVIIAATAATPTLEWRGAVLGSYTSTELTMCLGPPAVPCRFACATDQLKADPSGVACVLPEATGAGLVASLYLNAAAPPPTPPAPPAPDRLAAAQQGELLLLARSSDTFSFQTTLQASSLALLAPAAVAASSSLQIGLEELPALVQFSGTHLAPSLSSNGWQVRWTVTLDSTNYVLCDVVTGASNSSLVLCFINATDKTGNPMFQDSVYHAEIMLPTGNNYMPLYDNQAASLFELKTTACSPGRAAETGNGCQPCAAGLYRARGMAACQPCAKGIVAEGGTRCLLCPSFSAPSADYTRCLCQKDSYLVESKFFSAMVTPPKQAQRAQAAGDLSDVLGPLAANGGACLQCESFRVCDEEGTTRRDSRPQPGFSKTKADNLYFQECPNPAACANQKATSGAASSGCAPGYGGPLCAVCTEGYYRTGLLECAQCDETNYAMLVVALLGVCGVFALIIHLEQKGAKKPSSISSVLEKIYLNTIQLVSIVSALDVKFPSQVRSFMGSLTFLGEAGSSAMSIDCMVSQPSQAFLYKTILLVLLPLMAAPVILLCTLGSRKAKRNRRRRGGEGEEGTKSEELSVKDSVLSSMLIVVNLLYPDISRSCLLLFRCETVGDSSFLYMDTTTQCWESKHLQLLMMLGLPTFVVFIIGFPILTLIAMHKLDFGSLLKTQNENGHLSPKEQQSLIKYSFLTKGFLPKYWFWESTMQVKKLLVVACTVFIAGEGMLQPLSLLLVITISLCLQQSYKPYRAKVLNRTELWSLVCALAIVALALIYQDPPSQNSSSSDISNHQNRRTVVAALLITSILALHIVSISNILYRMNPKKGCPIIGKRAREKRQNKLQRKAAFAKKRSSTIVQVKGKDQAPSTRPEEVNIHLEDLC